MNLVDYITAKQARQALMESGYPGNIGFMEMVAFFKVATPTQKKEMQETIQAGNWNNFKDLIFRVLKIRLN